jgi:phosphoadenosine phosphosulfate reductase
MNGITMWDLVEHSKKIIEDAVNSYGKITLAVSWGKDSIVILHLARQIKADIDLFTVLTPFKPKETFEFKDEVINLWDLNMRVFQSEEKVDPDLHKTDPDKCCEILKVIPVKQALEGYDAWITGLRNTEGRTRKDYLEVEKYAEIIKINPILAWTEADIWKYTAVNKLPVHPWYGRGYRSLGCECCSKPGGETERDGRWQGTSKCGGECGIHTMYKRLE